VEKISASLEKLEINGNTAMIVRKGNKFLGILAFKVTPRENAKKIIENLKKNRNITDNYAN